MTSTRVGEHKEALVARVRVLSRAVGVALAAITCAFWFVQVLEGGYYRQLAENNRLRKISIEAPRGTIYDRHDRVLVENLPSYNLLLDRSGTLAAVSHRRLHSCEPFGVFGRKAFECRYFACRDRNVLACCKICNDHLVLLGLNGFHRAGDRPERTDENLFGCECSVVGTAVTYSLQHIADTDT